MGLRTRRPLFTGAGGAAVAAGVTWLLDRHHGAERRAALRDRGARALAGARARLRREALSDELIADRVRARLPQLGIASGSGVRVEVTARDGRVALRGVVPAAAHARIVRQVARVAGVREVVDLLELATELPGSPSAEPMGGGWPPPLRAFAAAAGLAAVTWAGVARTPLSAASATLGLCLIARSAANQPLAGLLRPS
jgi:hypothetical protein